MAVARNSTVNVPRELLERARAAVRLVQASGNPGYSLARFILEAFTEKVAQIERVYNAGRAVVPDPRPLRTGRPTNE